jgi:hypothetical protein
MTRRRSRIPAALAGATLLFAACGGDSATEDTSPATDAASTDLPSTDPQGTDAPGADPTTDAVCGRSNESGGFDEVACDDPHDSEFAGLVAPPTDNAPTDEEEQKFQLQTQCAGVVGDLVERPDFRLALDIGFVSTASAGGSYNGDIECWAILDGAPPALSASIADVGLSAALGEYAVVDELDVGACFVAPFDGAFNLVLVVPCRDDDAELLFGIVQADGVQYPGEDALNADGFAKCDKIAVEFDDVAIDSQKSFLTYPLEVGWNEYGQRTMLCTVLMASVGSDRSSATEPASDPSSSELVELEAPEGFVFGAGEPVCAIFIEDPDTDIFWSAASCAEPHSSELVALVGPPAGNLPADAAEATVFFNEICRTFVEEATGVDLLRPGVGIGFNAPGTLGGEYEGPVECYASFSAAIIVGSFQDASLEELIGDQVIIADLASGECFVFTEGTFASGDLVECGNPDALMFVGTYEAADGPYPGIDALRVERAIRCADVLAASGLVESGEAGDPATLSGTFPDEVTWIVPGRRLTTCDIAPA